MKQDHFRVHWLDSMGNPAGGVSTGKGFTISWQNGPLQRGEERQEPNGAFVETIIDAVIARIQFYQDSKFACMENEAALMHLRHALAWLETRTLNRENRGVEGTHNL